MYGKVTQEKLLKKDCDGIFLTEKEGKTYLFLCELKSKFIVLEIASVSPTDEMLSLMNKKMENDISTWFCYKLNRDAFYQMPKEKCLGYYEPLCMQGIDIHYISV